MGIVRNMQKTNLSLSDTFTPVSQISLLWLLLALTTIKDLCIFMWDIDSAYLHGKMDHNLHIALLMIQKKSMVGKLNKPYMAYQRPPESGVEYLEAKLKKSKILPLESNPGVFLCKSNKGIVAIDMHVDEGTGVCSSEEEELDLKADIHKFYKIKEKDTSNHSKCSAY